LQAGLGFLCRTGLVCCSSCFDLVSLCVLQNIIHGDLTPGNVLLKHDSSSPIGVVGKITDFGLCSTIDPTCTHISNITNGTPYYVAPEVVECGMLTKTSDVYSFGVLMWEVYRCMPPWVKTDKGYQLNKRFRRFPPTSPHIYVALCARCLDKRPKKRPSFAQILMSLEAMHNAYLMGYDNLQELNTDSPQSVPLDGGEDGAPAVTIDPAGPGTPPLPESALVPPTAEPSPIKGPAATPPRSQTFVAYFGEHGKPAKEGEKAAAA